MIAYPVVFSSLGGVVGTSNEPVTVWGINMLYSAVDGSVEFYSGTDTSGDTQWQETPDNNNEGKSVVYQDGLFFPNGCFINPTGSITQVTVWYTKI